jgi:hypothetical protein
MERVVAKGPLKDLQKPGKDRSYWLAQPVSARIDAVERLRLQRHPELAHADQGFQRIFRVAQRKRG